MEDNKVEEVKSKQEVVSTEENKPKDKKTLTEEFYKRHLVITKDDEGKEVRSFHVINAILEIFAKQLNTNEAIHVVNDAMIYLANEWDNLNAKKIITPEDKNFPTDIKISK